MLPAEVAHSRSMAYNLFGTLYLTGKTAPWSAYLHAEPALSSLLRPADEEQLGSDYHMLFGLNVFPFAGVFLEENAQVGGPIGERVWHLFQKTGYRFELTGESPEHIGHALQCLAFLAQAEGEAWEDQRPEEAQRMRRLQGLLMDQYLLWWLPVFVRAVEKQQTAFFSEASKLLLELVLDHRRDLGEGHTSGDKPMLLPPILHILDDENTGIKEIASFLVTPARSGFFLSQKDIGMLGLFERLPRGFGHREQLLLNLLNAAITYNSTGALLEQLKREVEDWKIYYVGLQGKKIPAFETILHAWLERLEITTTLLFRLLEASKDTGSGGD